MGSTIHILPFGRFKIATTAILLLTSISGCNSVPGYVIPPDNMAELLADMYTAESIVDINRTSYMTDSMKKVMKQSVYFRHGVTQQQVDTSFVWYGHHIEQYIEVYDKVIEILEKDIAQASANGAKFGVAGDSVDAWQWSRHYALTKLSPRRIITFNLPKDENWQKGDIYAWAMKSINNRIPLKWGISAEYPDGTIEYCQSDINGEGWNKLQFISDSTQIPLRIAGYIMATGNGSDENVYLDSISLIRDRIKPGIYHQRYRQRSIGDKNTSRPSNRPDSISTTNANQQSIDSDSKFKTLRERMHAK